jgi:hypothetical protein
MVRLMKKNTRFSHGQFVKGSFGHHHPMALSGHLSVEPAG